MKNQFVFCAIAIALLLLTQSCAPVFSELQSARMAGEGRVEMTPHFSSTSVAEDGDSDGVQNHFGLQLAVGASPKIDLRFRYENVWIKGDGIFDGVSLLGFGPKFSLIADRLALYTPIGTAIGEGITDSWQFQPTVFFTQPVLPNKIDFTIAPKYVIPFCKDCNQYFAFNTSVAISSDLSRWALRPEFGMLFAEDNSKATHISIGMSFFLGRKQ